VERIKCKWGEEGGEEFVGVGKRGEKKVKVIAMVGSRKPLGVDNIGGKKRNAAC